MTLSDEITILIPTNFTISAPSTRLIRKTLSSLEQFDELRSCRCIIGYDVPIEKQPVHMEYLHNLKSIKCKFEIEIKDVTGAQIRGNFLHLISQVRTPFFLLVEHDWEFILKPDFILLCQVMKKHQKINCVYFHKRANNKTPHYMMREEQEVPELPLMKTTRWSNNPCLVRTSHYVHQWIPILNKYPPDRSRPGKQIEPILQEALFADVEKRGFDTAHTDWGTYEYGGWTQGPMVNHVDGKHFQ